MCSCVYVAEGDTEVPVVSDFEAEFRGRWENFREYAEHYAEDTGLMVDWPADAQTYLNWWARIHDLEQEYTAVHASGRLHEVFVYRNFEAPSHQGHRRSGQWPGKEASRAPSPTPDRQSEVKL